MNTLKLRALRKQKGINQDELSSLLNITRAAYSMYETGKRQMNYETLNVLSAYFGVSVDFILGFKEENQCLTEEETDLVAKYRLLDARGKRTVSAVLDNEHAFCGGSPKDSDA
jgi:transcriptional regulator with XRE-family HTH domain